MLKMFVFWLLLQPQLLCYYGTGDAGFCDCPPVSNLHKAGGTYNSYSLSWTGSSGATQYRTWYVRQADGFTSASYSTTAPAYTFNNLSPGRYTFYVAAVCGEESSGFIGIDDTVEN